MTEAERQLNLGLKIIGTVSQSVTEKLLYLDTKTKKEIFKDFPLKGSPEETFKALAKWAEKAERKIS